MIDRVNLVTGGRGTFTSRSRLGHSGELFYAGTRTRNSMAQPSVSEGPSQDGYIYHRNYIHHTYWPFLLKLFLYLGDVTTVAAYWFYGHLATFSINKSDRHKFCILDILTINFACTCHCDRGDMNDVFKEKVLASLKKIVNAISYVKISSYPGEMVKKSYKSHRAS